MRNFQGFVVVAAVELVMSLPPQISYLYIFIIFEVIVSMKKKREIIRIDSI